MLLSRVIPELCWHCADVSTSWPGNSGQQVKRVNAETQTRIGDDFMLLSKDWGKDSKMFSKFSIIMTSVTLTKVVNEDRNIGNQISG